LSVAVAVSSCASVRVLNVVTAKYVHIHASFYLVRISLQSNHSNRHTCCRFSSILVLTERRPTGASSESSGPMTAQWPPWPLDHCCCKTRDGGGIIITAREDGGWRQWGVYPCCDSAGRRGSLGQGALHATSLVGSEATPRARGDPLVFKPPAGARGRPARVLALQADNRACVHGSEKRVGRSGRLSSQAYRQRQRVKARARYVRRGKGSTPGRRGAECFDHCTSCLGEVKRRVGKDVRQASVIKPLMAEQ
jgi:hypothetical protein